MSLSTNCLLVHPSTSISSHDSTQNNCKLRFRSTDSPRISQRSSRLAWCGQYTFMSLHASYAPLH